MYPAFGPGQTRRMERHMTACLVAMAKSSCRAFAKRLWGYLPPRVAIARDQHCVRRHSSARPWHG
jgi:hypothetical protein